MQIKRIHHVAILAGDYEKSKHFYTKILGFTIIAENFRAEKKSFKLDLAINDIYQIELFSFPDFKERQSFPEAKGLRHLAFAVDNLDEAVNELISKNVILEEIRTDELTNKRFCFFYDPNGQALELYEI